MKRLLLAVLTLTLLAADASAALIPGRALQRRHDRLQRRAALLHLTAPRAAVPVPAVTTRTATSSTSTTRVEKSMTVPVVPLKP